LLYALPFQRFCPSKVNHLLFSFDSFSGNGFLAVVVYPAIQRLQERMEKYEAGEHPMLKAAVAEAVPIDAAASMRQREFLYKLRGAIMGFCRGLSQPIS
jgi:hypothetical protein